MLEPPSHSFTTKTMAKLELQDITEDMLDCGKPWWKSKTIWFNVLTIGGAVVAGAVGLLPTLQPLLSPQVYSITLFVVGMVNVVLRVITDKGIIHATGKD